jgi:YVTN family beta-propeller protein
MNLCPRTAAPQNFFYTSFAWGMLATAIALMAQPMEAQAPLPAPGSGLINPRAIVFSPVTGKVYAVDTSHGAVTIYTDAGKPAHSVQVGAEPVSVAVNTSTGTAYVANAGDGTVSVIDGATDSVVATIPIGSHPYSIAADAVTGKVFVTHTYGDGTSMIDGATNKVTDLKTGSVDLIAINSQTGTVYLLGYGGGVKVLDEATQKFVEQAVGRHAWGLTIDDSGGTVYVTRIENADLLALKSAKSESLILHAGAIPCAIAVNAKAKLLYVANNGDNSVSVVDATNGHTKATIVVGDHPKGIAFDPVRNLVYVANAIGNSVTVIDAEKNEVVATLPAGRSPYALAVVPGSNRLYVANESDDNASTVVEISGIHKAAK